MGHVERNSAEKAETGEQKKNSRTRYQSVLGFL
jgi:hypothetical protein